MMQQFKTILTISSLLLMGQTVYAVENGGGLREEASTLENIYQEKARTTLDTLLNQSDYTLVVAATIKNDETKLKEYHQMVEKKFLPGMNMNDPAGFGEEHNILHSLKQKVEVQVILSEKVPADRDLLVKDILRSKLKISEESGDSISVVRAIHQPTAAETSARKLPELSTKMIFFLLALGAILVTAIAMWLYKRHEEKIAEAEARGAQIIERERLKDAIAEEQKETGHPIAAQTGKTEEELEAERRLLEQRIFKESEDLISLSQQYSSIIIKSLEEYVMQGKLKEVTLFLENIGWDVARKQFKGIDSKLWARIASTLRERTVDPLREEVFQAIHGFHRFALSYVLEKAGNNFENPFAFIFQLSHSQRMDLLQHEDAYNIGLISIYSTGAQMSELMSGLSDEMQNEILYNITKIKHLPEAEVYNGITKLLNRLEGIKEAPSIHIDGLNLAARFIRSLEPVKEEALLKSIQAQHPEEAERLRKSQVVFMDIPDYPAEMTRKVIEGLNSDDVLKALVGYPERVIDSFLGMLPTKKALMIQNDLFHMSETPPAFQCAAARRKITELVEQEFERAKFSVTDFWKARQPVQPAEVREVTELKLVQNENEEKKNDDGSNDGGSERESA